MYNVNEKDHVVSISEDEGKVIRDILDACDKSGVRNYLTNSKKGRNLSNEISNQAHQSYGNICIISPSVGLCQWRSYI